MPERGRKEGGLPQPPRRGVRALHDKIGHASWRGRLRPMPLGGGNALARAWPPAGRGRPGGMKMGALAAAQFAPRLPFTRPPTHRCGRALDRHACHGGGAWSGDEVCVCVCVCCADAKKRAWGRRGVAPLFFLLRRCDGQRASRPLLFLPGAPRCGPCALTPHRHKQPARTPPHTHTRFPHI